MFDNFSRLILGNLDVLGEGLWVTIQMCLWAFPLAFLLGIGACLVRLYVPYVRWLALAYIEFCRATPIFVQLLWVNYVWPGLFGGFPTTAMQAGVIALAMQSSAYLAETLRSGIEGLPRGQFEAAVAVGMQWPQIMRRIVMPQVFLVMAPSLVNQMAVLVKSSTLVSVIAIPDLMYQAMKIVNQWFQPIGILTSTALLYVAVIFSISALANYISTHFRTKFGLAGRS